MQDKNMVDNMAEKYKEEMMRLYSRKRDAAPERTDNKKIDVKPEKKPEIIVLPQTGTDTEKLMKPPMPKVPMDYGNGTKDAVLTTHKCKFPTAEEIMKADASVPAIATITSDPRFELAENITHNQGNYNYDAPEELDELEDYIEDIIPEIDYPDRRTDFEDPFDDDDDDESYIPATDMEGTGYLQVEVTTGDGAIPVSRAAVIVTQEIKGQNYLVTMKLTDRSGATDIIPLPAPSESFSEAPDPSERPFSEYNVTVYKKDFYTVPEVTVPVFDTVKSIQPVSLIPLAEYDLQGTSSPKSSLNGGVNNG